MELETRDVGQAGKSQDLPPPSLINLENLSGNAHFIGIGGIGMSALARILLARGFRVSGSDRQESTTAVELAELGARITLGHQAENVNGAGAVVVSTAIAPDNPELLAAQERSLPVWHRSALLAALTAGHKLIAVSGTHGKTTTTGMVAQVLLDAGLDPSVVVGGIFPRIGSNAFLGASDYFVAEADESDGTHRDLDSFMAVVTNIEADHLENYPGGMEEIRQAMVSFADRARSAIVVCADDPGCRQIRPRLKRRVVTYGNAATSPDADYRYESLPGFDMRVWRADRLCGQVSLHMPGEHNKLNALAAAAVGLELGLPFDVVAAGLSNFIAVARRFQILGSQSGVVVVDDYAHHPTEVAATLQAARQYRARQTGKDGSGRIVAVFQPHQPSRLRDLWGEFCGAFTCADLVLICDIYVARGQAIEGITSERFARAIKHDDVRYLPGSTSDLPAAIVSHLQPGDLVLTIGAGDITKVGWEILRLLKQGHGHGRDG